MYKLQLFKVRFTQLLYKKFWQYNKALSQYSCSVLDSTGLCNNGLSRQNAIIIITDFTSPIFDQVCGFDAYFF